MNKLRQSIFQWIVFFVGIMVLSYGVVLTIVANLGVSPWDVFHIGLANVTPISTGMAVIITGGVIVAIVCYYLKSLPQIGTLINMLFIGIFIDIFLRLPITPVVNGIFEQFLVLILGTFLFGFGAGLYISSKIGAGPRDGLVLLLHVKKGWSISIVRTIMELSALIVGVILGGPIGIGTIIISFAIGPIMEFSIKFWDRLIGKYIKITGSNGVLDPP
jgi:uncharacterized membrane protein YczE